MAESGGHLKAASLDWSTHSALWQTLRTTQNQPPNLSSPTVPALYDTSRFPSAKTSLQNPLLATADLVSSQGRHIAGDAEGMNALIACESKTAYQEATSSNNSTQLAGRIPAAKCAPDRWSAATGCHPGSNHTEHSDCIVVVGILVWQTQTDVLTEQPSCFQHCNTSGHFMAAGRYKAQLLHAPRTHTARRAVLVSGGRTRPTLSGKAEYSWQVNQYSSHNWLLYKGGWRNIQTGMVTHSRCRSKRGTPSTLERLQSARSPKTNTRYTCSTLSAALQGNRRSTGCSTARLTWHAQQGYMPKDKPASTDPNEGSTPPEGCHHRTRQAMVIPHSCHFTGRGCLPRT